MTTNEALQLKKWVDSPEDILPSMKPTGFPEPRAPVALFLRLPSGYIANKVPIAGGEIAAVPRPRNPQRTFIAMAVGAKAVISETRLRNAMPARSWILRPRRSAVFPENSINDPLPRLVNVSYRDQLEGVTYGVKYPIAAPIHVISAAVICKLLPIVAVLMTTTLWRKVVEDVAIMTANTKMHSSKLLRKCFGRAFGSCGISVFATSASTSKLLTDE